MRTFIIIVAMMMMVMVVAPSHALSLGELFGNKVDWEERYIGQVDENVQLGVKLQEADANAASLNAKLEHKKNGEKFAWLVVGMFIWHDMNRNKGKADCPDVEKPEKPCKPYWPPCR